MQIIGTIGLSLVLALSGWTGVLSQQGSSQAADSTARLIFTKVFRGSDPEYTRVTVDANGAATYLSGMADEVSETEAEAFRLSVELTQELFALAGALNYFQGVTLEAPTQVARLGEKTFAYERGGDRWEVQYNYTQDPKAKKLEDLFTRIATGRFLVQELNAHLRFDRLGMLDVLSRFEREYNAGRLVDFQQFVPVLEEIVGDRRLMNAARRRAGRLLERMQGAPASLQLEYSDPRKERYYRLVVEETGKVAYEDRRFQDAGQLEPIRLPKEKIARIWEMAQLSRFFHDQVQAGTEHIRESGYRFTYEAGPQRYSVAFSSPGSALLAEMAHMLQQVIRQMHLLRRFRESMEKDRLMLSGVVQELEVALGTDAVADPQVFVPFLEQIIQGSEFIEAERQLARRVLERIRPEGSASKLP